jgi:hypothetical protein
MLGAIAAGLKFLSAAADIVRRLLGMKERAEQQEIGATKQKAADLEKAVTVKDAQLEIASKPDETREELLKKARGRKRGS